MSLYRTWRPRTFTDLVGQDSVVRTLTSAIDSGKLAHAYLFSGPRGSGKTSAAKILARCINCEAGPTPTPDNTCDNCLAILAGNALDVLEIDAASNRGIDEIRTLREAVKFAPATMRMKIYIVDEAHMLTKEGANAFLRTLEEPPPHAVFILATTEPERLPVTILSRCQRYAFRRISVPVMIERMREIATAEKIPIDDEALAAIAYRADGGLRDALTMLEQLAAFSSGETATAATLDLALGSTGHQYAAQLVDAILAGDAASALREIETASEAGADFTVLTRALIASFRHLLVARVDPRLIVRDLAPEDAQRVAAQAAELSQATLTRALRVFGEAQSLARSGGNARLELETALLRYVLAGEDPTLDGLSARLGAVEERLSGAVPKAAQTVTTVAPQAPKASGALKASETPRASEAPKASEIPKSSEAPKASATPKGSEISSAQTPGALSLQKVRAAWQSIRGKIESERQSLRAPLSRAAIESLESNAIVLSFPNSWSADALREHVKIIEGAIADVLGVPLRVTLRVDSSAGRAKAPAPTGAGAAERSLQSDDPDALFDYANERIR
ncbi:MAG TPA: DNA polymerase III subunit gamma/tau [Candidatus Cybelea sp.]|nr:DNA polymerase III subunit gamma/tau [Candidatus Cybelea sp.]